MYWSQDEADDYIRYPSEGNAEDLGSPIRPVGRSEIYDEERMEELIEELEERGFDYAPIRPYSSHEYLDVASGDVHPIQREQMVGYDDVMLYCINILTEYPFAFVTHPDPSSRWIVTAADLTTRAAKEFLFPYYSETAKAVSDLIKEGYDVDEIPGIYEEVRPNGSAMERWQQAVDENVELHPVEYMSLADLKEVVRGDESLLAELDFRSRTHCAEAFDLVEKYRNNVMHGNRSVVSNEGEVEDLVASLEIACEIAVRAGGEGPGSEVRPQSDS